jgi:MFS family permease
MRVGKTVRLAGMMAGVYAIQGAWWPLLAVHLQDLRVPGRARGWIFATLAIASLLTPLGIGRLADRRWPAQRLLSVLYILGAGLLAILASGLVVAPAALFVLFLAYWLLTAPGTGLCSAIALRHLDEPARQFGGVRLWGTIGWMAVGWLVALVMTLRGSNGAGRGAFEAFGVASVLALLFAAYAGTLPHTPPLAGREPEPARGATLALLRRPSVALMLSLAFGASLTSPFVYQVVPAYLVTLKLPRPAVAPAMSLGQLPEIVGLALLPRMLAGIGFRVTMAMGLGAWVLYFGILASRPSLGLALVGVPVQGLAIALFHIVAPMYLDTQASGDLRASAQGLYLMITVGLGNLLGSLLAGEVVARFGGPSAAVFLVPLAIAATLLVTALVAFRPGRDPIEAPRTTSTEPANHPPGTAPRRRDRRSARRSRVAGP